VLNIRLRKVKKQQEIAIKHIVSQHAFFELNKKELELIKLKSMEPESGYSDFSDEEQEFDDEEGKGIAEEDEQMDITPEMTFGHEVYR
jgi:hypothetical protein